MPNPSKSEAYTKKSAARNPLVQVSFELLNMPHEPLRLPGLETSYFWSERLSTKLGTRLDLEMYLTEVPEHTAVDAPDGFPDGFAGGLFGQLVYSQDVFETQTIDRFLGHFSQVLDAVVTDPGIGLSDIGLTTAAERTSMLALSRADTVSLPEETVVDMIVHQAQRTPDVPAVVCGDNSLTYRELDQRSNQLANRLHILGVDTGTVVAVCLERDEEAVVSMLAVWKAGGVYAPVDPAYPAERRAYMITDVRARVLVTRDHLASGTADAAAGLLLLDKDELAIRHSPADNPRTHVGLDDLAYVIYTSGSTGEAKGVEVEHRGLANLVHHQAAQFGVERGTRCTHAFGLAFDASVSATVLPLTKGATFFLQQPKEYRYGPELAEHLERHQINVLNAPVPVVTTLPTTVPESLHCIGTGAETLPSYLAARWSARVRIFNNYGPTEATVVSTMAVCRPGATDRPSAPIGRPIPNTSAYVLDGAMGLVPVGVAGELFIGGVGVARGYRGRPGVTADRFVPDPFGGVAGGRLYRTGDLVRWLPDGNLEFVGRLDHQVKVRGYRVELGEVEVALRGCEGVVDAVVVVRDVGDERRLVAFVVVDGVVDVDVVGVRASVRRVLPEFMVPAVVQVVEGFPLTANGKVDRAALSVVDVVVESGRRGFVAPQGPVQEIVAAVWEELLGVERVSAHDDFFDLGGDSLFIVRMVHEIQERLHVELELGAVFDHPTVAELSAAIDAEMATEEMTTDAGGDSPTAEDPTDE